MVRSMASIVSSFGILLLSVSAQALVIHVDASGGGDYLTIQEGINEATYGDTVLVFPGSYEEHLAFDADDDGVVVMSRDGRDATILQGAPYPAPSLVSVESVGSATKLIGFTLHGNGASAEGGAIYCVGAAMTVEDCAIVDCSARYAGGGLFLDDPSGFVIRRSEIRDCWSRDGGGILVEGGQVTVEDTDLLDNWVSGLGGVGGGGVSFGYGQATFTRCLFQRNSSPGDTDGLWVYQSADVDVVDCSFVGQTGPAVNVSTLSTLTVSGCVFTGNGNPEWTECVVTTSLSSPGDAVFTDNVFCGNEDIVLLVRWGAPPAFTGNSIDPNGHLAIVIDDDAQAGTLDALGNWWGTTNPLEIAALIQDCNDDPSILLCVDFSDWCTDSSCSGQVTEIPGATQQIGSWGVLKSLFR